MGLMFRQQVIAHLLALMHGRSGVLAWLHFVFAFPDYSPRSKSSIKEKIDFPALSCFAEWKN